MITYLSVSFFFGPSNIDQLTSDELLWTTGEVKNSEKRSPLTFDFN